MPGSPRRSGSSFAEVTVAALDSLAVRPGDEVWAAVKATEVTAYPA